MKKIGLSLLLFWNFCAVAFIWDISGGFAEDVSTTKKPKGSPVLTTIKPGDDLKGPANISVSKNFTGNFKSLQRRVTVLNNRVGRLEQLLKRVNRTLWEEIRRQKDPQDTLDGDDKGVFIHKNFTDLDDGDFKVVCSFTAWASYRQGIHKFAPEDISAELCTDIVYDYAILDSETLTMVVKDVSSDIDDELYQRVLDLKTRNPRLRVHLSLGGWADSEGNKFSRLVSSLSTRQRFVANAVEFLKKYKFDGLDVAWMFPVCWQTNCQAGSVQDRQNFADFIQELRYAFDRENPRLYLSITVSGSRDIINRAYQIEKMIGSLDRVDLMSYDLAGHWFGKTGHHAPLYIPAGKETPKWSVNDAVQLLLRKGVPPNKLVLGIPTYGIGFTLASSTDHKIGARVTGPSTSSEVFGNEGRFAFYELCERVKNRGWTKITDPAIGPYVYKGNEWVGYDDVESAATKAKYIKLNKLGGATIWDVTLDDFNAHCCDVKNPLLNAVSYILNGRGKPPKDLGCEPSGISPDPAERLDPRLPA